MSVLSSHHISASLLCIVCFLSVSCAENKPNPNTEPTPPEAVSIPIEEKQVPIVKEETPPATIEVPKEEASSLATSEPTPKEEIKEPVAQEKTPAKTKETEKPATKEPVKTVKPVTPAEPPKKEEPATLSPTQKYGALLQKYVSFSGRVDYQGLLTERADLDEFISYVSRASGGKLSFYINAYNALVLAALLDNGLPKKVLDVKGFFDAKKYKVAGKSLTLNQLEDNIRKTYKDARIHFVLNCGAKSCPPLRNRVFSESGLDKTLTKLTNNFLNGSGVKIDEAKKEIKVTKLMDWYGQDFKDDEGSLDAYLKKYVTKEDKKISLQNAFDSGYKIAFQSYNWEINKK